MSKAVQTAVISIAGCIDPSVKKAIASANKAMGGLKVGVIAAGAAIGGAAIASGKYLLDLGKSMDSCYDAIRIGTGATGKALESLKGDFKEVYSSVPGDAQQAAQAVADFNTRLGLSGKELQGVSKQAMLLSNKLGAGELGGIIESSSKAFQNWNIPADEMAGKMDYLFKVSQSTGISYQTLATSMQQNGMVLQELGYNFDSASALIGQMDKAGVNVSETLSSMKRALAESAKAGVSAADAYKTYYKDIKNAKTSTEAATIASELFGTKAGPQMALAIRSGALSIDELTKSLQGNSETISTAAWDTMSYSEKLQVMKQRMQVALAPLGDTVFDSMNELIPLAQKGIELIIPVIQKLGKNIPAIVSVVSGSVQKVIGIINTIGPEVAAIVTTLISTIKPKIEQMVQAITPVIQKITSVVIALTRNGFDKLSKAVEFFSNNMSIIAPIIMGVVAGLTAYKAITLGIAVAEKAKAIAMTAGTVVTKAMTVAQGGLNAVLAANPIGAVCVAIAALVAGGLLLYKNWNKIIKRFPIVGKIFNGIKSVAQKFGAVVIPVLTKVSSVLKNVFMKTFQTVAPIVQAVFGTIGNLVKTQIGSVVQVLSGVISVVKGIFTGDLTTVLQGLSDGITGIFSFMVNGVTAPLQLIWSGINSFVDNIGAKIPFVGSILVSMRDTIQGVIDNVKGIFDGVISFIQNVFAGNWSAAWQNVQDIFKNAFGALAGLVKQPLNAVISLVNGAIGAINKIGFTVPDWVPGIGGKAFKVNIPQMPMLATGGIATKPSIVGEGGYPEYVITTDPKYRKNNIDLLGKATAALAGQKPVTQLNSPSPAVTTQNNSNSYSNSNSRANITVEYKPNITVNGGDKNVIDSLMKVFDEHSRDIADKIKAILKESEVGSYGVQW